MPPEKPHWAQLYSEVVTSGLCTGCAGCVIACPYDVLTYDDRASFRPIHVDEHGGAQDCTYGARGCTLCTRACPRFRTWEAECDTYLFGRQREPSEVAGQYIEVTLARATDADVNHAGQDGGLVSALLIWALETKMVDAALVSYLEGDGRSWRAVPGVARSRDEVLASAGSRYTYSANTLAYKDAVEGGAQRLALAAMSCQASAPAVMASRKAGKVARRFELNIGLLCSKTFDDAIFTALFDKRYGLRREEIAKINIKGVFEIWLRDGSYHEVPLAEGYEWTRAGCMACPDFSAEHADISAGGIGAFDDWTLAIVRTERGSEVMEAACADGVIEKRPIDDDPAAVTLLRKLSRVSRRRWPEDADPGPRLVAKTEVPLASR